MKFELPIAILYNKHNLDKYSRYANTGIPAAKYRIAENFCGCKFLEMPPEEIFMFLWGVPVVQTTPLSSHIHTPRHDTR